MDDCEAGLTLCSTVLPRDVVYAILQYIDVPALARVVASQRLRRWIDGEARRRATRGLSAAGRFTGKRESESWLEGARFVELRSVHRSLGVLMVPSAY